MAQVVNKVREADVVEQVDIDELMKHTIYLAEEDRETASPGEARAMEYFRQVMEGLGLEVNIQEIENYISLPISASVEIISPVQKTLTGLTPSFSANTPKEGLELELVAEDKTGQAGIKGLAVLRPGLAAPVPFLSMEQQGAAGQVWINWGDLPNNSTVTTIWGHPTPDNVHRMPKTPAISLGKKDGEYLLELCAQGPVKVRLHTELEVGFMNVPLAVADLKGIEEPDKYVLFNAHIDSWHKGATDNGTANACMLEVARILAEHKDRLRRGVRFVWWSGHSQGRYSGSTWYADHHWEDLHDNAIVHLNVDSLGCQGATDYSEVECSAEMYELGRSVIKKYAGQSPKYDRIGHSGDNSFWGVGLPSLFQLVSHTPPPADGREVIVKGLAWFWHTMADTVDKIDKDILLTDVQIYMASIWRLCTWPVMPISFVEVAEEFELQLSQLQDLSKGKFDLAPALEKTSELKKAASKLKAMGAVINDHRNTEPSPQESMTESLNACLMDLSRILMPVNYTSVSCFDFDPAMGVPPLPRLRPVTELATKDPQSDQFKFLERKLLRERNRVCHALNRSIKSISVVIS